VSKTTIVETQRQPARILVTQSLDVGVTTIGVEMVIAPTMDVIKMVVLIGSTTKLGSGSSGISARRKLSGSTILPTTTIGVVQTPQMVFTNLIMTIHMNKIVNQPSMNLMAIKRYRSVDAMNPKGGYQEPFVVITQIPDHKDGHYVRLNMVALKYLDLKKDVDPNVHVKVFNSTIKANVKNSKEYIINAFSYMLRDMTSN
jgi:hypothetical protein